MKLRTTKCMAALGLAMVLGCRSSGSAVSSPSKWALEATPLDRSAAELNNQVAEHLAWAKAYRNRITEVDDSRTIENTLVPYNEMMLHLDAAGSESSLLARVHPNDQVRAAAEVGEQAVHKYVTELTLDRDLCEAFKALNKLIK